jgi:hypothetical protein
LVSGCDIGEDAICLGAPVRAARKARPASLAEQAFIGEVGDPRLAFGGA